MPSKAPPEMHTNAMHDNAIAFMVQLCCESAKNIRAACCLQSLRDQVRPQWLSCGSLTRHIVSRCVAGYQYTLRRTTLRGATTTAPRRTTGRATTAAPPAATQPARTTPRAQTTALASIVLKAMKLPASNREIVRYFITVLLGL